MQFLYLYKINFIQINSEILILLESKIIAYKNKYLPRSI